MTLTFSIPYRTTYGQRLVVCGSLPALGHWNLAHALPLAYDEATTRWSATVEVPAGNAEVTYKYVLLFEGGGVVWEWGGNRTLAVPASSTNLAVRDFWRAPAQADNELFTAAFTKALFRRPAHQPGQGTASPAPTKKGAKGKKATSVPTPSVRFQLEAPRVDPHHQLCVLGSDPALGNWDNTHPLILSDAAYPAWRAELALQNPEAELRYKYGLWSPERHAVVQLETGDDRVLPAGTAQPGTLTVLADEGFRYAAQPWRGAGVAMPVFSLRSEKSLGVGEFSDLKLLIDWAEKTGLNLVQILPINDTTATHTWVDSYPYAAISVFALHPQYLHLEGIAELKNKADRAALASLKAELNAKDFVDYEAVMNAKWKFLKLLYKQEKAKFLADPEFQHFKAEQADWLIPYAAFSALRERFGTADFNQWPREFHAPVGLAELTDEHGPDFDGFGLHFFTQFHLDKQLRAAVDYGRRRGVVLKGDLPIGIYRHSVDAWTQPELYHMDQQAGAPPDDFSTTGQNWRFPTYNWERMAQDNYLWWRQRLGHLSRYFDALRIDHILGFFRIWEMPGNSVEGLLGHFSPALPLHRDEIQRRLGWFDYGRLCEPYIRWHLLERTFGNDAQAVLDEFMVADQYGAIQLKPAVSSQRLIETYVDEQLAASPEREEFLLRVRPGLYHFVNEVLFLPAGNDFYHPRITLNKTASFAELADDESRRLYDDIYVDFFFRRHDEFWREQGLVKLPAVRYATDMLICGEDLGMVPASVPGVMHQLGILGLNIQRMPSNPTTEFGHPNDAPYLSVVTTGSHDMSTLRGWWEEDRVRTQRFFETTLGHWRQLAPYYCEPWVVREVLNQHLYSPAMWAIFPLQDFLGMDTNLRRANPHDEQINVPSNPQHFWKYRLHLTLEELNDAVGFNEPVRALVEASGRGPAY
ncbi:4-alpha-glucanotransferase [Hymenobacter ginsengisoli]|uniref:4-alpha-glucanotransferase n=1 Tax=Hymenobacter ginsengisoli TaxID=1051626 RepID=A0ABP8QBP3_9BACT|nr:MULTISPECIES: 4-alpha-glucanotransferase [unclassified Hymenobacter]MBO2032094.1 4-alpha-glucanotransferase [Hymenobacter sp. BT559]